MRVRVKYSKQGLMKFIGHLDMMRYFQKACRRAGIDVVYTEGLSPHMSMSFALPLGVGMTSDSEYVDVDLKSALSSDAIVNALNESAPEGIHFTDARQIPVGKAHKGMTLVSRADYTLRMTKEDPWDPSWPEEFICWLDQPEILVLKKGKKTEKEMNIRPLIYEAKFVLGGPPVTDLARPLSTRQSPLKNNPEQPFSTQQPPPPEDLVLSLSAGLDRNIRPELVMQAFARQTKREYQPFRFLINRDEVYADLGKEGRHRFVPLIDLGERIP